MFHHQSREHNTDNLSFEYRGLALIKTNKQTKTQQKENHRIFTHAGVTSKVSQVYTAPGRLKSLSGGQSTNPLGY